MNGIINVVLFYYSINLGTSLIEYSVYIQASFFVRPANQFCIALERWQKIFELLL